MNHLTIKLILFLQFFQLSVCYTLKSQSTNGLLERRGEKSEIKIGNYKQEQDYPKFKGIITVLDSNSYKFNEKTLVLLTNNNDLRILLKNGIFYPNIITGDFVAEIKSKEEIAALSDTARIIYSFTRTDSIMISDFHEMPYFNSVDPTFRKYKFLLWRIGFMNPQECYIDLESKYATKETTKEEFLRTCKVVRFEKGSILI